VSEEFRAAIGKWNFGSIVVILHVTNGFKKKLPPGEGRKFSLN